MTYCSLQELYLHSYGQTRTAGSLQHGHQYNVLPGLHFHSKSMHIKGCVHVGVRGDRSILTFVKWAERLLTMETRSLLQTRTGGCWTPGTSLSLWGFFLLFPFFSLRAGEKRGGEEGSRSVAVLGARLTTAVSYSIFWSPCKSRSLVEPAVVSEWKTSNAIMLGQAVAACPHWVLVCSVSLQ